MDMLARLGVYLLALAGAIAIGAWLEKQAPPPAVKWTAFIILLLLLGYAAA